jgi:hypothetical protein
VVLETHSLERLREQRPEFLTTEVLGVTSGHDGQPTARRRGWVVKNSDVETDASWGSRGLVIGSQYTETHFERSLLGNVAPGGKTLGRSPVLQRFAHSDNLAPFWNAIIAGDIVSPDPARLGGWHIDDRGRRPATRPVSCRLGPYLLFSNRTGEVFTTPVGLCTVRQDVTVHGAQDARLLAVKLR